MAERFLQNRPGFCFVENVLLSYLYKKTACFCGQNRQFSICSAVAGSFSKDLEDLILCKAAAVNTEIILA